ncbi:MAG: hypothetical protein C0394_11470 [Syntrophus sp. (in: bacteria)]|nr:hypothetical protein [Syntrophus sp. (in: bacteria)]
MKQLVTIATFFVFIAMTIPAAAQTAAAPSGHESHGVQEAVKPSTPAAAQDSHAGHDTGKPSPAADAVQPNAHDHATGKHAQMMDAHMKKMKTQMEKIRAAVNPAERRKLMQEQMAGMRDGMKMMKEAPGCRMMAGGMKGGESGKMEMKPMGMGPMMMCHQMMEKKMEMMQVMMEGLIEASQMKR